MKTIAVVSGKGGSGKTFVAINVACGLVMQQKKCLLIDCSFGVRNIDVALGRTTQTLCNIKDLINESALSDDVIIKGDETYMPDFIAASPGRIPDDFSEKFHAVMPDIFNEYDYVVIDTPSSTGVEFDTVTSVADIVIAVSTENYFSRLNTGLCLGGIDDSKKKYLIINRCTSLKNANNDYVAEDLADECGASIIGIIREDEYAQISLMNADPIVRYDSYSGNEFERICQRIIGEFVAPDKKIRLFERNKYTLK